MLLIHLCIFLMNQNLQCLSSVPSLLKTSSNSRKFRQLKRSTSFGWSHFYLPKLGHPAAVWHSLFYPASAVVLSVLQYRIEKCIFLVGAQIRSIERAAAVRHSLFVQPRPSLKLVTTLLPYQLPNDFCLALSCCLACLIHPPHLYCL